MNRISTLAFAAALLGVGGMATAPAAAKDKPQAPADGLKLSETFRKVAAPAQAALTAKDYATADTLITQAQAAATTDDEKFFSAALRYDLENQKLYAVQDGNPTARVNETVLAAPIDALLANPSTPAAMRARLNFRRGQLAFNGRQYPQATQYFQKAKQLGYADSDVDVQIVKAKIEGGDVAGGSADMKALMDRMTASGQKVPEDYYRYLVAKSNGAKDKAATLSWLSRWASAYPTPKTWRDVVVFYGLQQGSVTTLDNAQKLDLYRLLHDTRSLTDQSIYQDYAESATKRGLSSEAVSVLREGQAAGRLQASAIAPTLAAASAKARGEGSLAPLDAKARTSANGELAAQTADGYLSQGQNAKAADLYRVALSKGGVATDDVNTHLGIALSRSGDKAGAQAAFAAVKTGSRADIAGLWSTWVGSNPA